MQSPAHQSTPGALITTVFHKAFAAACLAIALFLGSNTPLQACGGTPTPPCGRSVFLAKFAPFVVVVPAAGPITVPIGLLPFAQWDNVNPQCAQPLSASVTLTLSCTPSGLTFTSTIPLLTPVIPGAQPLPPPGTVPFIIPAGTFPPGTPPQICAVMGTYMLTFSDGVTLSFTGDTEVCIVPPSTLDPAKPRLDMQYIPLAANQYFQSCRRGDQAYFYFLIANNDPDYSVSIDLWSTARQVAHLPDGITPQQAYLMKVFSISNPVPGTDTYPAAFVDDLLPGVLLPEPNPFDVDDQMLTRSLVLAPGEATIVGIAMRSYGMCANGSCNERSVKVMGSFSNGDPALACASTVLIVDEMAPKSALCEYSDFIKVSEGTSLATWGHALFSNAEGTIPNAATFYSGNLNPDSGLTGFLTVSEIIPSNYPSSASDYLRMNGVPDRVSYLVDFTSQFCENGTNNVLVSGLDSPNASQISIPIISFIDAPPNAVLDIHIDYTLNLLIVGMQSSLIFQGPANLFFQEPPPGFCIDPNICRIIKKESNCADDKTIFVEPKALARLFDVNDVPGCDTLEVFNQMGMPVQWEGTVAGSGVALSPDTGDGVIYACYGGLASLPLIPETTLAFLDITCTGALNNPVRTPVAIRVVNISSATISPARVELLESYPNPFSEVVTIQYVLKESATVSLKIFDCFGREVRVLMEPTLRQQGEYSAVWDGGAGAGSVAAPGLYYCQIMADGSAAAKKLVRMRE